MINDFEYLAPKTLDEALAFLDKHQDDYRTIVRELEPRLDELRIQVIGELKLHLRENQRELAEQLVERISRASQTRVDAEEGSSDASVEPRDSTDAGP